MVRDIQSRSTNLGVGILRSFLSRFSLHVVDSEDYPKQYAATHTEQTISKVTPFLTEMNNYFSQHVSTPLASIDAQHQRSASLRIVLRRCHDPGVLLPVHHNRRWR